MKQVFCKVGDEGRKYMPYSEVCMHMRVSGKVMRFKVISGCSVQLYKDDGKPMTEMNQFSGPITTGEAGLFDNGESGFYYYPDDSKDKDAPSLE